MTTTTKTALLLLLTALTLTTGCIPNRKIAYLQYGDEYRQPTSIQRDSLIRRYSTGEYVYRLNIGDLLDIKISTMTPMIYNPFADADRNLIPGQQITQGYDPARIVQPAGYYVENDGLVNIPLLGKIMLEGYTISQAEDTIEAHVRKILEKPVVRLKILNYRFTVLGEVKAESTYITGDNTLSLLEAIGLAGGASEFGDLSRIKIIRDFKDETAVFYVDLLSEEFLSSPFYFVQPGDVIVVTPLKQRAYLKYAGPNLSIIAGSVSLFIAVISLLR
jgi:polysaccharide biosynthesis/export protein